LWHTIARRRCARIPTSWPLVVLHASVAVDYPARSSAERARQCRPCSHASNRPRTWPRGYHNEAKAARAILAICLRQLRCIGALRRGSAVGDFLTGIVLTAGRSPASELHQAGRQGEAERLEQLIRLFCRGGPPGRRCRRCFHACRRPPRGDLRLRAGIGRSLGAAWVSAWPTRKNEIRSSMAFA
jgi:hypothetical protein